MKTWKPFLLLALLAGAAACRHDAGAPSSFDQSAKAEALPEAVEEVTLNEPPAPPEDQFQPQPNPAAPPAPPQQPRQSQPEKPAPPVRRQIIKTAEYRIQVKSVEESTPRIAALVERQGGYVSSQQFANTSYLLENTLTLRIPAQRFDAVLDSVGREAVFTQYKNITSQDVTEEFVDIEIRLKTKRAVRDRYMEILRIQAKTVRDVLAAEEQIRVIQEEIEAKEGRLRFLKDQVGMSTIQLAIFQETEYRPEPKVLRESFWSRLSGGLRNGWDLTLGILVGLASIWPLVLMGVLVFWRRRWILQKLRRR